MIDAHPETWPTGDVYWRIAHAIAHAEGADIFGSVPDRLNNPLDISDGLHIFDSQFHDGSHVTKFPDKETGWGWGHDKLQNIALGKSHVFKPSMTWAQIGKEWAGDSADWVNNVCSDYSFGEMPIGLNVSPDSTFQEFVNSYTGDKIV